MEVLASKLFTLLKSDLLKTIFVGFGVSFTKKLIDEIVKQLLNYILEIEDNHKSKNIKNRRKLSIHQRIKLKMLQRILKIK